MEKTLIPDDIRNLYPFGHHFFLLKSGYRMNYVEEGNPNATPVVMVHGNPTWSFFYRNIIQKLKTDFRVIAPDHIGCGLSEKPSSFSYQLSDHIENLNELLDHLKIEKFHLIVHDWGGAIGSGVAVKNPDRILSITYMNTAAFTSKTIPWTIDLLRKNFWGEWFIRSFNGFAGPATIMASHKGLEKNIKKGYLLPYNSYQNRIATAKFVKDIPLSKDHPSYSSLFQIEQNLKKIHCPIFLLWGEKDFCFTMEFFHKFKEFFPHAKTKVLKEAGHYLLEDCPTETSHEIFNFLTSQN